MKNHELGRLIRQERLRKGLSIRQLAKLAGTSDVQVGRIERGQDPQLSNAAAILAALRVRAWIGDLHSRRRVDLWPEDAA